MTNNKQSRFEDLAYWKNNAEENYTTTPISVLKYIYKLEEHIETIKAQLPSDEEIWNEADKEESNSKHYAFTRGARYVIDKIQGGNNEQQ